MKPVNISHYLAHLGVLGLFIFSSPSLLSETVANDHDHPISHKETYKHAASEHDQHGDRHEDHDEDDHSEEKQDEHDKHDDHGHEHGKPATDVELSPSQMKKAGIETLRLKEQLLSHHISALGEVKLNQYRTIQVSPSITSRVEKRHVRIGDKVKKGTLLATLHTIATTDMSANVLATADLAASSAELAASIAEAKGELAAANATWKRIQALGKDAVAGKRYTEARLAKEQAQAKLNAYGKSQSQVKKLIASGSQSVQKHFKLRAEQAGVVIKDDFVLGQIVNPEDVLFVISDMDHLWIEANIKPHEVAQITKGSSVTITSNDKTLKGKVIYISRLLNEKTRTLPVRIEVNTAGTALYPGVFVKTSIATKNTHKAIVVPDEAVLRGADGDWMLFVEEAPGRFVPKEIEIIETQGNNVIIEGIKTGTTIISKGAFFVQSERAKSSFEVHNH